MRRLVIICLFLSLMLSVTAVAAEDVGIPSDKEVMCYALSYMQKSQENMNLDVKDFVHLYDFNGNITGYYVTFSDNSTAKGYMLLSLISGVDPVVELAFDGMGPLYYSLKQVDTSIVSYEAVSGIHTDDFESVYSNVLFLGPDRLYVPLIENNYYSVYEQKIETINQSESDAMMASVDIYDGVINWNDASINPSSVFKIQSFTTGNNYWLATDFVIPDPGNCASTALTNVLWYWGHDRNRASVNSRTAGTTSIGRASSIFNVIENSLSAGNTKIQALTNFFSAQPSPGGTWNYTNIPNGSLYSSFTNALNNNCPLYLGVHTTANASGTNDIGHGMFCLGHAKSTSGVYYLIVMDGWYRTGRIVNFGYYPYIFAYKIWVS